MPFDFASVKLQARRVVHKTLGVLCHYQDDSLSAPVEIRARWHNQITLNGDLENSGYAQTLEGIDRVVFDVEESRLVGVNRNGLLTFTAFAVGGIAPPVFEMDHCIPSTQPGEEIWAVTAVETP